MMLCSLLSYIDRQTLAVLSPTIPRDTGLTAQSYGEIVSAFSIAYMLTNPIWESLLDYIGLRAGMTIAVAMWTVSSTVCARMTGFSGFAMARPALGLGEGATFPVCGAGSAARDTIRLEGSVADDRSLRSPMTGYMGFCIPAALSRATPGRGPGDWRRSIRLSADSGH